TGFQVASVHSMVLLSAIIKPVRFANDDENDSFDNHSSRGMAWTRENVRTPVSIYAALSGYLSNHIRHHAKNLKIIFRQNFYWHVSFIFRHECNAFAILPESFYR